MSHILDPFNRNETKRGDLKRCDFCGYEYQVVEVHAGQFLMVHSVPIIGVTPAPNVVDRGGNPINGDPAEMIATRRFSPVLSYLPHQDFCPVFAQNTGKPIPSDMAAGDCLPPCKCGHAWTAHRHHSVDAQTKKVTSEGGGCKFKECSCEGYRQPEEVPQ